MGSSDRINSKLITLLKDSVLISTNVSNEREIVFDFLSNETNEWSRHFLYIRDSENFYFQHYESSFQRSGLVNLRRIKIKNNQAEWISEVNDWNSLFTKESGVEFKLYNGSIFRFVGSNLSLEQTFVEGPIDSLAKYADEKPDHIGQSKAKVIVNETFTKHAINKEVKTIIKDTEDSISDVNIIEPDLNEMEDIEFQAELKDKTVNIDPEYEEALNQIENLADKKNIESSELTDDSNQNIIENIDPVIFDEAVKDVEPSEVGEIGQNEEKISLINQISDYALPKQSDTLLPNKKIDTADDESKDERIESSILKVNGVTKTNQIKIEALGFDTVSKLSVAKISELIKINGVGKATARKIINSAKSMTQEPES